MSQYILSHDIGTSSDKAVLVDFDGKIIAMSRRNYPTYYPNPAWVEQDPADYWKAVCETSKELVETAGISKEDVKGIVFSTQAQGVIPVDKDGNVLYNNITWVDGRAQAQAEHIMRRIGGKRIFTLLAGTPIMGKDCIAKITWLKEERPDIYAKTDLILDVNGYLKFKCTGKKVTELSGASSYGLDLKKKEWMSVFPLVGIDINRLPPLVASTDIVGGLTEQAAEEMGLALDTPVFGGCDDVQAAVVGSGMCGDGDVHIYLGTSAWVCASTKDQDTFRHGAAAIQSADREMNLIAGITESAGSNIEWLKEQFFGKEFEEYGEGIYDYFGSLVDQIPPGSDHLICTPWMLGERCPVSSTTTRATLYNLSMDHTREHMLRAVFEGIGYNLRWILENYRKDYGFSCNEVRIIGGGGLSKEWMQIIADITGAKLSVVEDPRNAGAVGAAMVALIGLGHIQAFADTKHFVGIMKSYTPNPANKGIYDKLFADYKNIYRSLSKAYGISNGARFEAHTEQAVPEEETTDAVVDYTAVMQAYGKRLTTLSFPVSSPTILLKVADKCLKTADGVDPAAITEDDLVDATHFSLPEKNVLLKKKGIGAMIMAKTPHALACIAEGKKVAAATDDFAQIVGAKAPICPRSEKAIRRALGGSNVLLIDDGETGYVLSTGRTLYEALLALIVTEKGAEMQVKGRVLGGVRPLRGPIAEAERQVYRHQYSRAENKRQQDMLALINTLVEDPTDGAPLDLGEISEADSLILVSKKMLADNLVQGTWGNLSVRLGDGRMLVTPSGLDYRCLTAADMVKVDLEDLSSEGLHRPTSESSLHAGIYRAFPEAGAVIHTHANYCTLYAACHMPLEIEDPAKQARLGHIIPLAPYGISGTKKLADNVLSVIGDAKGALMTNHGMICYGKDLAEAYAVCCEMEAAAKEAIERRLAQQ